MFVQYGGMNPIIDAIEAAGLTIDPAGHADEGKAMIEAEGWALNASGIYEKDGVASPLTFWSTTAQRNTPAQLT